MPATNQKDYLPFDGRCPACEASLSAKDSILANWFGSGAAPAWSRGHLRPHDDFIVDHGQGKGMGRANLWDPYCASCGAPITDYGKHNGYVAPPDMDAIRKGDYTMRRSY